MPIISAGGSFRPDHKIAKVWDPSLGRLILCGLRKDEFVPETIVIKQHEATKHEATSKETTQMNLNALMDEAERAIDERRADDAEYLVEKLEKAVRHRVTVTSHDDANDNQEDDWSEPANARANGNNADLEDDEDDTDAPDNSSSEADEEDDDEDDDVPGVRKDVYGTSDLGGSGRSGMYAEHGQSVYPATNTRTPTTPKFLVRSDHIRMRDGVTRNEAMRRARKEYPADHAAFAQWKDKSGSVAKAAGFDPLAPRGRSSTHPRATYSTSPAVGQVKRNVFDDLVDAIQRRDGCTRTTALQRARAEHPSEYSAFQGWLSSQSTVDQAARRSATNTASKRGPVTYEDACRAEMRKGCSTLQQAQIRVEHAYGNTLPRAISKGTDIADTFQDAVFDAQEEFGCSLCEAQTYIRKSRPDLFKLMQSA